MAVVGIFIRCSFHTHIGMTIIRISLLSIISCFSSVSASATELSSNNQLQDKRVIVVGRTTSSSLSKLSNELQQLVWQAEIVNIPINILNETSIQRGDIIITVGAKSFRAVAKINIENLIIATYISNGAYNSILKQFNPFSIAVYSDPPVSEQISLINGIYASKGIIRLGVLLSKNTKHLEEQLRETSETYGIELVIRELEGKVSTKDIAYLNQQNLTVLLLMHDPSVVNPTTGHILRHLLETAYSNGYGIVGFSKNFVSNGSIASIHYSPKHIAHAVSKRLSPDASIGFKVDSEYPRNFSIAINKRVALSLGLYQSNVEELVTKIKKNASFIDASFEFVYVNGVPETIL